MQHTTTQPEPSCPVALVPPDHAALALLRKEGKGRDEDVLNAVVDHARRGQFREAFGLFFALESGSGAASHRYMKPYSGLVGHYRASLRAQEEEVVAKALLEEHAAARRLLAMLERESGLRFRRTRAFLKERCEASERRAAEDRAHRLPLIIASPPLVHARSVRPAELHIIDLVTGAGVPAADPTA